MNRLVKTLCTGANGEESQNTDFEPGEIRQLKIPMKNAEKLDVNKIDKLIRDDRIDEVLD